MRNPVAGPLLFLAHPKKKKKKTKKKRVWWHAHVIPAMSESIK
jgi:hypothetical protein